MKKQFKFILFIGLGFFLNSCYYDSFPEDIGGEIPDVVSYSNDIMPLWEGECVACHNGSEPPDLRPENSYSDLLDGFVVPGDPDASILYRSLIWDDGISNMPITTQWPDSQIALVEAWIEQGALDN